MLPKIFVANTDSAWFDFLAERARGEGGRVGEVNFWQPRSQAPMVRLPPGAPVFFRRKRPDYAVAGYGFFASFALLRLDEAWRMFESGNGDPDEERFLKRIGRYRRLDLLGDPAAERAPIGCTILRDAVFWPRARWISWTETEEWARNIVQGKTENDPARVSRLLSEIQHDHVDVPDEFRDAAFRPLSVDHRELIVASRLKREGQGAFRARLLEAYDGRCAITGEHTKIVLDAAHIQPYLGPRSNHVQNGLLLTKEFHALFDQGYVTVTPEHEVRVSPRLYSEWNNGHRYRPFDGGPLKQVPDSLDEHPSQEVLEWHGVRVFKG